MPQRKLFFARAKLGRALGKSRTFAYPAPVQDGSKGGIGAMAEELGKAPTHCAAHRRGGPAPLPIYVAGALEDGPDIATAQDRLSRFMDGIARWRAAPLPLHRPLGAPIWQNGAVSLRPLTDTQTGPPVLIIPSLINGPHILHITEELSLLEAVARRGRWPVLVDWGTPGPQEQALDLTGYVTERLRGAYDALHREHGRPDVLGYCMGGTLGVALAQQRPQIERLALIGAPWAFGAVTGRAEQLTHALRLAAPGQTSAALAAIRSGFGVVPQEIFQLLFALLDPAQAARKFARFAAMAQNSAEAARFVAIEDWLCSGPPMAAPAVRQLIEDWYLADTPAQGAWCIAGEAVCPIEIRAETLIFGGTRDHIAPPQTIRPLARMMPNATYHETSFGHVGMIASPRAHEPVVQAVATFFAAA